MISSWYDFAVLLIVFPVCHWGNSGHKGRWIGLGGIVMAVGSLVCALPHWMAAPYVPSANAHNESDFGQCTIRFEFIFLESNAMPQIFCRADTK